MKTKSVSIKKGGAGLAIMWLVLIVIPPFLCAKTQQDSANDTFGDNSVTVDLLSVETVMDAKYLYLSFGFVSPVLESDTGSTSDLCGYIDLDVDQDHSTGTEALCDSYGGSTGMGMDYYIDFMPNAAWGTVALRDCNARYVGEVTATFDGTTVTLTLPLSMIGDEEGNIDYAAVFGDREEPDDIVPNTGAGSTGSEEGTDPDSPDDVSSGGGCFIGTLGSINGTTSLSLICFISGCLIVIRRLILKQ